uniref:Keratin n=1 Tax=Meleagris gallopavo TaxID=9103 RepID=A0A803XUN6_MELGA
MKRKCCGKTMTPHLMTSLGWACNSSVLHSAAMRRGSLQALRHSHSSIKAGPVPRSLTPLSCRLLLCALPGTLHPTAMSCYDLCRPCGPTPLANSCNEPCVRQCQDSQVVIQPSTVVVTLPGPILSSFPQNTAVGSSSSAAVGSALDAQGVAISSGGFGFGGLGCFNNGRARYPC